MRAARWRASPPSSTCDIGSRTRGIHVTTSGDMTSAPASALVRALRAREIGSRELLDAYLDRIEQVNPAINAVVTIDAEAARAAAAAADEQIARGQELGALHGLPMTVKDALETAGMRTASGFPDLAQYVPARDADAVARLRGQGAVILGKTNLPTFAMDWQTYNPIFGTTNNPRVLRRPGRRRRGRHDGTGPGERPQRLVASASPHDRRLHAQAELRRRPRPRAHPRAAGHPQQHRHGGPRADRSDGRRPGPCAQRARRARRVVSDRLAAPSAAGRLECVVRQSPHGCGFTRNARLEPRPTSAASSYGRGGRRSSAPSMCSSPRCRRSRLSPTITPGTCSAGGLPVGIQVIAPYLEDRAAIDVVRHIERHLGGFVAPPIAS
jgi:hypothetical protein